jgi:beta-lactamase class A
MNVASGLLAALVALTSGYQGKVAVYATDITTGREVALNADTPVPTASVIKLAILFEALKQMQEGRVHFDDPITMNKSDQVGGSGVLGLFDTPMQLTLKDALTMMIATSDNTGTNLVIDHLGLKSVDDRIGWMGLEQTWLYKKVFTPPVGPMPADQKQFGLGKTTAREMAAIMTRFATCNLNAPGTAAPSPPSASDRALCDAALNMLKHQTDGNSIPRYLTGVDVANKTGSLDDVRNDVAIVYAKNGPIVISAFTYENKDQSWTPDNAGALLIGRVAKTIVDTWQ